MMKYRFGNRSDKKLRECATDLQTVVRKVMSFQVMDFAVIEGHRTIEVQQKLFREGRSQIDGVSRKGKHNFVPSQAADLLPCPANLNGVNVWVDRHRFTILAGLMFAAAAELGVKIRWGGDWSGDGSAADQTFNDLPHYELII